MAPCEEVGVPPGLPTALSELLCHPKKKESERGGGRGIGPRRFSLCLPGGTELHGEMETIY